MCGTGLFPLQPHLFIERAAFNFISSGVHVQVANSTLHKGCCTLSSINVDLRNSQPFWNYQYFELATTRPTDYVHSREGEIKHFFPAGRGAGWISFGHENR